MITVEDGADQTGYAAGATFTVQPIVITTPIAAGGRDRYPLTPPPSPPPGATTPYRWSLASGSGPLPPGLRLEARGTITGNPKSTGTYPFTVQVVDRATLGDPSSQVQMAFTITVS